MSARAITAVVLAGGRGTRIAPLIADVPKPMVRVAGVPFLHWVTLFLARHGIADVVYATGFKGDQIADWCADGSLPGLQRRVSHEAAPLGTGGGLLQALPLCGAWVLVVNGDSLCLDGLDRLLAAPDAGTDGAILGLHRADASRYGSLETDARGNLTAFREKVPGAGYVYAGMLFLRRAMLEAVWRDGPLSIEHDIMPDLLSRQARIASVLLDDAPFIDIGTPETLAQAEAFLAAHRAAFAPTSRRPARG